MDNYEPQRKRQFVDGEDFTHPSKTDKVGKVDSNQNFKISILAGETAVAGPSGVSGIGNAILDPRSKKMPLIAAKFARVDTTVVNGIKAQTSGQISFEYAANGLKIRTMNATDHHNVARYLVGRGTEFYTFNPNQGQMVNYILRGLPPPTECEEKLARLREKGMEVIHAPQMKRNIVEDGMEVVTLLPMWVITVPKRPKNINNLKQQTRILNFVIRIQD